MKFDWLRYLELADELPQGTSASGVEARLRASISQFYYGLFHLVRQKLQTEDPSLKFSGDASVHQQVAQQLKTDARRTLARRKLAENLGRLRQYRNDADYADEIDNPALWHALATGTADRVKNALANL